MKWAIPADSLLKCQSGTLPPPPFTELNISLCQNKLGNPQIFFSSPLTSMRHGALGRSAGGSAYRQFTSVHMKAPWHATRLNTDISNSYNLIREAGAAAAAVLQTFPLSNYTGWLFLSPASCNVLWKQTPGLDQRPQKQTRCFCIYEHFYFCHLFLIFTPTFPS